VLIALPKIRVHNLHRRFGGAASPGDELVGRVRVAAQHEFCVRYDNAETAVRAENAPDLARQSFPVVERKMLEHVLTKNAVEQRVREREWAVEVEQTMHIPVAKPVDVEPVGVVCGFRSKLITRFAPS
jgi:uncharacterized membrane protein YccC